jgi:[acyl-carrier-protein] S-malonyltransferase
MAHITSYLFPGQGSQGVGMGQALAQHYEEARQTFAESDAILGFQLSELCFRGPADILTETSNAQPALLTASIAALRALHAARPELPQPAFVAGHSLGEYSALVAAGVLQFADAVRLTRVRGELMARAGQRSPGSMAAILGIEDDQVAAICVRAALDTNGVVQVANYNSPGQVVISGEKCGVERAMELAKESHGRCRPLAVSIAAHSALMASVVDEFAAQVAATPFEPPARCLPVIGNLSARPLSDVEQIRGELVGQLTGSVRWTDSIRYMIEGGTDHFVEIGPGAVLTGLVKRIAPLAETANVAVPEDMSGSSPC